jgi:hypothetical protein
MPQGAETISIPSDCPEQNLAILVHFATKHPQTARLTPGESIRITPWDHGSEPACAEPHGTIYMEELVTDYGCHVAVPG